MRWFATGDVHGDWFRIWHWLEKMDFAQDENIAVIILGDAALYWNPSKFDAERIIKRHEENYKAHIYFLDGNHENFDLLKQLPIDTDGVAHISEHIHYLPRGFAGWIHTETGKSKICVCGGADSIDKFRRVEGISWWADETITKEDIAKIPVGSYMYVLSHCCPRSVFEDNKVYLATLSNIPENSVWHESEDRLEELKDKILYDKWLFGHYHVDKDLDGKHRAILNDFVELI